MVRKIGISTLAGYGLGIAINVMSLGTSQTTLVGYLTGTPVLFGISLGFALGIIYGVDKEHADIEKEQQQK